jgi:hypothetical protein
MRVTMRKALILLLLLTIPAVAQVPVGPWVNPHVQFLDSLGHPLSGGKIYTYVGGTLTPKSTYTDSVGTTTNANPVVLDSGGYADIWLGPYTYKFIAKNSAGVTQWTVDNVTSLSVLTHGLRFADQYASIDAAFTDCATCTVVAPAPMSAGTPASSFASGTLWDLRGNTTPSNSVLGNTFSFNVTSGGGTKSFGRFDTIFNTIPASGSVVALYSLANAYNLTAGTGVAVIGGASEANLFGTLTGNLPYVHAREDAVTIASSGGTVGSANAVIGYVDITGTTAVTDVRGGWFRGCNTISGTAPPNCYGVVGDDQGSKASGYNFAGYFKGKTRIGYGSLNVAGIFFDDHNGVPPVTANIYTDSTDTLQIAARNATGLLLQDSAAVNRLQVNSSGVKVYQKVYDYNGTATAGNGLSAILGATSQKAETAADTNVLTFTPPAAAGMYRVDFTLSLSAANTATLGWTATWKDSNGNAQTPTNLALTQVGTAAPALTFTTSAAGNYHGELILDVDNSATAVVVKLTFSGTSFAGKASATIERIQ